MSALQEAVDDYVAVRRSLGFKLKDYPWLLGDLVAYAEAAGASTLTSELAVSWALGPGKQAHPSYLSKRLSVARGFARHLQAFDPATEVPPADLLPWQQSRAIPFLYSEDDFKKPNPFEPDVVVPIDPVLDQKVACVDALESQFYEWNPWLFGYLDQVPKDKQARLEWTRERITRRSAAMADRFRSGLVDLLGPERGKAVKYAEAFEVCEYGSRPDARELRRLFPFLGH